MNNSTAHSLFQGMKNATYELFLPRKDWAIKHLDKQQPISFDVRLGSGRKTYLRSNPCQNDFKITFGKTMISEMASLDGDGCLWLSYRELTERGYVKGDISPLAHLSHVVIHEFAHWIQVVLQRRDFGSVHNKEFYEIMQRMYQGHAHHWVQNTILLSVQNTPQIADLINQPYMKVFPKRDFFLGQKISFKSKGVEYQGAIIKINKVKAKIILSSPEKMNGRGFSVPYTLLKPYPN